MTEVIFDTIILLL